MDKILQLDVQNFVEQNNLSFKRRKIFVNKLIELRTRSLELTKWLDSKGLKRYSSGFHKLGYIELESVRERMQRLEIKDVINSMDGSFADYQLLVEAVQELKNASNSWMIVTVFFFFFNIIMFVLKWLCKYHYCENYLNKFYVYEPAHLSCDNSVFKHKLFVVTKFSVRLLLLLLGYGFCHMSLHRYNSRRAGNLTFFQYLIGYYLDPKSCQVEWLQEDKAAVGSTASFLVKVRIVFCELHGRAFS